MGAFGRVIKGWARAELGEAVGALAGAALDAIRSKPLDETHAPYKRAEGTGRGPRGELTAMKEHWECSKAKPVGYRGKAKEAKYQQFCQYVGPAGKGLPKPGSVKVVKTTAKAKKARNKQYESWLKGEKKAGRLSVPHNNPQKMREMYQWRASKVPSVAAKRYKYAGGAKPRKPTKVRRQKPQRAARKSTAKRAASK